MIINYITTITIITIYLYNNNNVTDKENRIVYNSPYMTILLFGKIIGI